MNSHASRLTAVAAVALAFAGCGKGEREPAKAGARPLTYDGATSISRVLLKEAVPAFEKRTGHSFGAIGESGGGKGLERLFAGEVELAGVARGLTAAELQKKPYLQIIGYDAIGVFVHEKNPVKGLSKAQLKAIFTGTIVNWKDAGGPNLPIVTCTEPLKSGRNTLSVFQATVLDDAPFGRGHELPDPADCVALVAGKPGGVTFATVAYALPGVRGLPVDGVEPTPARVVDSTYLLSRPLLLVARGTPTGAAAEFFEFMRSPEGQAIVAKKFIPAR
jgi:phosphate transport system substrate-binding protein